MRIVLRVMFVLVGAITLLMSGVMAVARARGETPPLAVAYTVTGTLSAWDGIYLTRVNGDPVRRISPNQLGVYRLQWDQKGLVFVSNLKQGDVYRMSLDGKRLENLTNSIVDESQITLSPDGKQIALGVYTGFQAYLAVIPANGGNVVPLVHVDGYLEEPAWSPDGRWIAFVNHTTGEARIYVARTDGTDQKLLFSAGLDGVLSHLGWSADGEWIYFSGRSVGQSLAILRIRRTDGEVQLVVQDGRDWQFERFSPDGHWMTAIQYTPTLNSVLMLLTSDGHVVRPLSPPGGPQTGVREQQSAWSPDGKWIAYSICTLNHCGIRAVSLDGSTYRWLVESNPNFAPQYPTWSLPVESAFQWWMIIGVGLVLVLAGVAPWSDFAWTSGPSASHQ